MRDLTGMVLPVYFDPSVEEKTVERLLCSVLEEQHLFLDSSNVVFVVDRATTAENILDRLSKDLGLDCPTIRLARIMQEP